MNITIYVLCCDYMISIKRTVCHVLRFILFVITIVRSNFLKDFPLMLKRLKKSISIQLKNNSDTQHICQVLNTSSDCFMKSCLQRFVYLVATQSTYECKKVALTQKTKKTRISIHSNTFRLPVYCWYECKHFCLT